jgi:hypothetical protein
LSAHFEPNAAIRPSDQRNAYLFISHPVDPATCGMFLSHPAQCGY